MAERQSQASEPGDVGGAGDVSKDIIHHPCELEYLSVGFGTGKGQKTIGDKDTPYQIMILARVWGEPWGKGIFLWRL